MLERLTEILNRPADDDFYNYPDEHYSNLSEAHRHYVREVAKKRPEILYIESTLAAGDATGEYYDLSDLAGYSGEHFGKMRVFTPPGPVRGREYVPAAPGTEREGFYRVGTRLYLTIARVHTPGLYILWVPVELAADLNEETDPILPSYCHEAIVWRAAGLMARKPGSLQNPQMFFDQAMSYWSGDPRDPSDNGALGTISHQSEHEGLVALDSTHEAWWRGIP